jgi:hypothetical protein
MFAKWKIFLTDATLPCKELLLKYMLAAKYPSLM